MVFRWLAGVAAAAVMASGLASGSLTATTPGSTATLPNTAASAH